MSIIAGFLPRHSRWRRGSEQLGTKREHVVKRGGTISGTSTSARAARQRVALRDGGNGARRRRGFPLGAQRRGVRERKDVLGGNRNVGVIRKSRVTSRKRNNVGERNARRDDGDWRRGAAVTQATALGTVRRCRVRAGGRVMIGAGLNGRRVRVVAGGRRRCRSVRPVHRARVRDLRCGRDGNEPEAHEQGSDATPQRAPHGHKIGKQLPAVTAHWSTWPKSSTCRSASPDRIAWDLSPFNLLSALRLPDRTLLTRSGAPEGVRPPAINELVGHRRPSTSARIRTTPPGFVMYGLSSGTLSLE